MDCSSCLVHMVALFGGSRKQLLRSKTKILFSLSHPRETLQFSDFDEDKLKLWQDFSNRLYSPQPSSSRWRSFMGAPRRAILGSPELPANSAKHTPPARARKGNVYHVWQIETRPRAIFREACVKPPLIFRHVTSPLNRSRLFVLLALSLRGFLFSRYHYLALYLW